MNREKGIPESTAQPSMISKTFWQPQMGMAAAQLPPTDDAFEQYVMRAALQTAVWKSCDLASYTRICS